MIGGATVNVGGIKVTEGGTLNIGGLKVSGGS